ncbi:dimethylaniline monooxygenase [N-oxide-forming] 2-like isoform 1-T4 [Anomaloglossus baeobatrachus]|uniref:dimethylaniline monooxygenase [N-oxide-forming] 2-like n=1 Tax=Anomaloglossus baeobatrachus TaxID=238106 RepID=UPI003F50CA20
MKVAVIGAGNSGLTATKCCLDEGLEPTCYERSDDIGGLWRFTPEVENGRASIYQSVVTNTSKEMMCYSDFPFPESFPNFLHNSKMLEYYRKYAENFGLLKYVQFKTVVRSVKKHPSYPSTGQWEVTIEKNGKQETNTFDAVMVCSGHHTEPYYPLDAFPGINKFQGQYLHSREYKTSEAFKGKRVVILGMGNSGADIAVELSRTAAQVFLSTRRGSWLMSRVFDQGYPWDICFDTRFQNWLRNTLPTSFIIWLTEKKMNEWFNHANYGLQPQDSAQFKEPLFNDELPSRITCGYVVVKPNVTEFTETSVKFDDGTTEDNIDAVIFATGYRFSFPFLDESIIKVEDNKTKLFRNIFPVNLEKPTLGVIGLVQPLGPIMCASEMQARWMTRVFKGLCTLPTPDYVMKDIEKKRKIAISRFGPRRETTLQVDYIEYLDELTTDIGCKPNILGLFVTDPILALTLLFGPCTPAQFRLTGPGKWSMARKQIMTTWDRILKPTKTRVVKKTEKGLLSVIFRLWGFCALVVLLAFLMYKN